MIKIAILIISAIPTCMFFGYALVQISIYVFTGVQTDVDRLITALAVGFVSIILLPLSAMIYMEIK